MKFRLQNLFTSTFGVGNALFLSRIVPRWLGYPLADFIADRISSFRNALPVRAVRANQWVVSGEKLSAVELDSLTRRVYRYKARALYDYYHDLGKIHKVLDRVRFSPIMETHLERMYRAEEGTMLVIPHVGNFDEAGQALAVKGLRFQILSYPNPSAGYRWENRLRKLVGMEITPMSLESMRLAKRRLQSGGVVLTGMDRPLEETNYWPRFFGRPAPVPVAYIRMALQTRVPVVVIGVFTQPGNTLLVDASENIEMTSHPDREQEIIRNAEKVLRAAEEMILRTPEEWVMFYPVWPETLQRVP